MSDAEEVIEVEEQIDHEVRHPTMQGRAFWLSLMRLCPSWWGYTSLQGSLMVLGDRSFEAAGVFRLGSCGISCNCLDYDGFCIYYISLAYSDMLGLCLPGLVPPTLVPGPVSCVDGFG
jgi:hypothetical protein